MEVLVAQASPTLCDSLDCSLPGSSVHGVLQALLQGIFPTQESNPNLLYVLNWQADSLPLAPPGKPINLPAALSGC